MSRWSLALRRRIGASIGRSEHRAQLLVGIASFLTLFGCATYNEELAIARAEADRGAYPQAIDRVNGLIGADSSEELPESWEGDRALGTLERSVLLQAQGEFALSARDMSGAESELELLDIQTDVAGGIGKYIYSDSSANYRASPVERLALSALNMANYLALGDLGSAAVEARRYTNARDYLESIGLGNIDSFGSYLAGFIFERMGQGDRALRYYEEALRSGSIPSLDAPIGRLARTHPFRGPGIQAVLDRNAESNESSAPPDAEILAFFALGRVPHKVPNRIPIGAAVGIAGSWVTGNSSVLERSVFKVVVYPEFVETRSLADRPSVNLDGAPIRIDQIDDLAVDLRDEYEQIKPQIIGAAISRMITRAIAAEGARAAGRQAGGGVGLLAALLAEGSLVALDRPDTRSWSFLPRRIGVSRIPVSPGAHRLELRVAGVDEARSVDVELPKGGFAAVVVTIPR